MDDGNGEQRITWNKSAILPTKHIGPKLETLTNEGATITTMVEPADGAAQQIVHKV